MMNYIKQLTFYNQIMKLKKYLVSHFAIIFFYLLETIVIFSYLFENKNKKLLIFSTLIVSLVTFLAYMILIILNYAYLLILKKELNVKNLFIINNKIYHIFWIISMYFIIIGTTITLIAITEKFI